MGGGWGSGLTGRPTERRNGRPGFGEAGGAGTRSAVHLGCAALALASVILFFFFACFASSLAGNLETPGNGGESGARAPFERRGRGSLFSHRFSLSLGILTWCVCVFAYVYSCVNIFFNFNMLKKLRPPSFGLFGD